MATITSVAQTIPEQGQTFVGTSPQMAKVTIDAGDFVGDDTVQAFSALANTYVHSVALNITEAFSASTTIIIGDGVDDDRFMDATLSAATATGFKGSGVDEQPGSGGYLYTAADTIDLVFAASTPTAGTVDVYLLYSFLDGNL